jgi:hypothetical protein
MNNEKTKCDNCDEESKSESAQGSGFPDNGIELYPLTLGFYGGFWDNFPLNADKPAGQRVAFCHDCTLALLRSFPAIIKGLAELQIVTSNGQPRYGMHPCEDETPCCEFAWQGTDEQGSIMLANPKTKNWEKVALPPEA